MSNESKNVPDGFMWFRRRRGDYEEEAIGKPDDIQRLFLTGKNSSRQSIRVEQPLLPIFANGQGDSLLSSEETSESPAFQNDGDEESNRQPSNDDFIRFYREKSPRNLSEQIVVITYYYIKMSKLPNLTYADYNKAYDILAEIPVDRPSGENGMRDAVNNTLRSSKYKSYVRRINSGQFTVTLVGIEFVEGSMNVLEQP